MSTSFILYIEDDENDVLLLRDLLHRHAIPARVLHVRRPREFLDALSHLEPDLILADGNVPGFDTASALQLARERCPQAPFYYLSGAVSPAKAEALKNAGADGCLEKDDGPAISTMIRERLRQRHHGR